MKMKLKTKNDKSNKHETVNRKIKARQATGNRMHPNYQ